MSGKKILSENTVRRFMELASIPALGARENFISEMYATRADDEKDYVTEVAEDPLAAEDPMAVDAAPGEEELDVDPDLGAEEPDELGALEEPGAADISLTEDEARLLIDLGERLREAMGDEEEPGLEDEFEEAPEDELPPEEAMADEAPEAPAAPEAPDDLVSEVLKRVTKRLLRSRV